MDLELTKKKALVTGSSRGIGFAIARRLVAEGCAVTLCGRNTESLAHAREAVLTDHPDAAVFTVQVDLSEKGASEWGVSQAVEHMEGLQLLVNNVGTNRRFCSPSGRRWSMAADGMWMVGSPAP